MSPVFWDRREEDDRRLLRLGKERLAGTNLANESVRCSSDQIISRELPYSVDRSPREPMSQTDETKDVSPGVPEHSSSDRPTREQEEMRQVREALRGLRFGTVTIIVQDGVVVQIDRLEKRRLRSPKLDTEHRA
jgi:hypothetical protein